MSLPDKSTVISNFDPNRGRNKWSTFWSAIFQRRGREGNMKNIQPVLIRHVKQ